MGGEEPSVLHAIFKRKKATLREKLTDATDGLATFAFSATERKPTFDSNDGRIISSIDRFSPSERDIISIVIGAEAPTQQVDN